MLERLEHDNLFVIALDDERRWYRYHHLFADFLRSRLQREQPERMKELHRRAAEWYEQNGWTSEAVRHALAAQEHDRAADLVEQVARKMWNRGEVMTLLGWLEELPEERRRRRPQLLLQYSAALLWVGRLDDVEPLVQEIERAVGVSEQGRDENLRTSADEPLRQVLLGGVAATRSWHAYLKGEPHGAIALARRALELLPETDLELRTFAAFRLAEAHRTADDLEAASAAFAETAELGRAAGHDYLVLKAMSRQAELQMARGRLRSADHVLQRTLRFAVEQGGDSLPATGEVHVIIGELLYEWNELESAGASAEGRDKTGRADGSVRNTGRRVCRPLTSGDGAGRYGARPGECLGGEHSRAALRRGGGNYRGSSMERAVASDSERLEGSRPRAGADCGRARRLGLYGAGDRADRPGAADGSPRRT